MLVSEQAKRAPRLKLLLCVYAGTLSGCAAECEGLACASLFTANQLTVHRGTSPLSALPTDPLDAGALTALGEAYHGVGWRPGALGDVLVVGLPDLAELRPLTATLGAGGATPIDDDALRVGAVLGEQASDRFGASFAMLEQPDGQVDLWVGAPNMLGPGTAVGAGAVYRFVDWGARLDEALDAGDEASLRVLSETAADRLGEVMAGCGDHDGDGLPELLVAAPWDSSGAPLGGRVHLIGGAEPDGLAREVLSGQLSHTWTTTVTGARLGGALSCAHDLSGDQLADLVLGAPYADAADRDAAGVVYILLSDAAPTSGEVSEAADIRLFGGVAGGWYGASLASGDLNGDGLAELAVGAPGVNGGTGAVYVHDGDDLRARRLRASVVLSGEDTGGRFGQSIAIADIDGDGVNELIVGAPELPAADGAVQTGALYLFSGGAGFGAPASLTWRGETLLTHLGARFAAQDIDGDGAAELLLATDLAPQ